MEDSIKKEDSNIKKAIKTMEHWIEFEKINKDKINKADELIEIQETILLDYKRVLKENEILKEEKEQAWEEWNNLEQGSYNTEQDLKQQIKQLKQENDELKHELNEENRRCMILAVEKQDYLEKCQYHLKQNENLTKEFSNYIPIQKLKDAIEKINKMIAREQNDAVIIQLGKQKRVLQKLLESKV